MKLARVNGRASLLTSDGAIDIEKTSNGQFSEHVQEIYSRWDEFLAAAPALLEGAVAPYGEADLGSPVEMPAHVFAIGLNYGAHATEVGVEIPTVPTVFTKFPATLTSPFSEFELSGDRVDWEVELVVVISKRADFVAMEDAWSHVAGLAIGQDISDRTMQFAAGGQFSLGKSYRDYGPIGPWLTTLDDVENPDDLSLRCWVNDELMQDGRTSSMIYGVPHLISAISDICPLLPGDVIFAGTCKGTGVGLDPPRFLKPGDVVRSEIEGLGQIHNAAVAARRS